MHVEYNDTELRNPSEITMIESHEALIVREWNKFVHRGIKPSHVNESIFKSWQRSKDFQVDPYCGKLQILLSPEELQEKLAKKKDPKTPHVATARLLKKKRIE